MTTRRFAVLAHYDPHGLVAPHVRYTVTKMSAFVDHFTIVSTADLADDDRAWLERRCELVSRPNVGHDFASYRTGIEGLDLARADELVVMNDSAVFPLVPLEKMFRDVDRRADFWGITQGYAFRPHLQSYFVVYRGSALRSGAFSRFWGGVEALDREAVIMQYEVGLSTALLEAGLVMATYFQPSLLERVQGAIRADGDDGGQYWRERSPRKLVGWARRTLQHTREPEWNVSAALADRALGRHPRLPMVKLSVLRDDPYHLDTEHLLTACERRHPEAFAGVRDYLRRTR